MQYDAQGLFGRPLETGQIVHNASCIIFFALCSRMNRHRIVSPRKRISIVSQLPSQLPNRGPLDSADPCTYDVPPPVPPLLLEQILQQLRVRVCSRRTAGRLVQTSLVDHARWGRDRGTELGVPLPLGRSHPRGRGARMRLRLRERVGRLRLRRDAQREWVSRERVDNAQGKPLRLHRRELLLETLASGGVAETRQHGVDDVKDLEG
jgi:hypothetical protein